MKSAVCKCHTPVFRKNTNWTRQSLLVVFLLFLLGFPQEPGRYILATLPGHVNVGIYSTFYIRKRCLHVLIEYESFDVQLSLARGLDTCEDDPFILVRTDLHLGWKYCSDACCFRWVVSVLCGITEFRREIYFCRVCEEERRRLWPRNPKWKSSSFNLNRRFAALIWMVWWSWQRI